MSRRVSLLLLIFALALLTACSPIVRPEQLGTDQKVLLNSGNTVGQTFVAEYDGLMGMEIAIRAHTTSALQFHLRSQPDSGSDLATGEITLQPNTVPIFIRLPFAPQADSREASYYFVIESDSIDSLVIRAAPGVTYLNGSAYQNGEPLPDAQLAFRLVYEPKWLAWGLVKEMVSWMGWVLVGGFLFVIPGWGILSASWPRWDGNRESSPMWAEKVALAVGVSLAIYPVLFAWAGLVGWGLGMFFAWGIPLLSAGFLVWKHRHASVREHMQCFKSGLLSLQSVTLLILLALLFLTRFWAIRHLEVGLWGDSVHHTLITQLMVEHGGLFDSWEPYNDLQSFTYHFGFHTGAALFHWLTGMAVPRAVVVFGQLVNVFAVWSLIPLANKIAGLSKKDAEWAGIGAVLLAGLLVSMPAFYVNWGRYTQLAGQAILPVALWLVWELLESSSASWRQRWVIGMVLCGLALTHYRVMIFAGAFFVVFGAIRVWWADFRSWVIHAVGVGLITGLLFLPWLIHLFSGQLVDFLSATMGIPASEPNQVIEIYNQIGDIRAYLPMVVWWGMLGCMVWGLFRRNWRMLLVGGWSGLMFLVANPGLVWLPGAGAVNNFSVFIAAYLSAGILLGAGLAWGIRYLSRIRGGEFIGALVVLGVAFWASPARMAVVSPTIHALATRPDLRAGAWIQENLPEDALLLVNSFGAVGDSSVVGSDGGWWMPMLSQRKITLPPILYVSEAGPRPDYLTWVNDLTFDIQQKGVTAPDVIATLTERGVTHVYIGQQQGRVNWPGTVIEPDVLLDSPHFQLVYQEDRVWVFTFIP